MKRTQIYLPERQHKRLKLIAMKQHSTVSEVIRQLIDERIRPSHVAGASQQTAGDWLLEQANWAETTELHGPSDLATKLDEYLYG